MLFSITVSVAVLQLLSVAGAAPVIARRDCTPADGVATDGNMFWADNCDLGAGDDGWGQKAKRAPEPVVEVAIPEIKAPEAPKKRDCTPADGVATDGNMFWADNCDLGAGDDGWGQK